jgi:hypothetical protein
MTESDTEPRCECGAARLASGARAAAFTERIVELGGKVLTNRAGHPGLVRNRQRLSCACCPVDRLRQGREKQA